MPTATPAPADPAEALRIADPWTLDDEFPEVRQQILDGLAQEDFPRAEVRHVTGPNGESAFLMAADAGLGADTDLEAYARRLSESTQTGGGIEALGDQEVALLQTDDVTIVAWIEPPLRARRVRRRRGDRPAHRRRRDRGHALATASPR